MDCFLFAKEVRFLVISECNQNPVFNKSPQPFVSPISSKQTITQLRWLVACFLLRRPRFDPTSGHVGFVVDNVAFKNVFSEYLARSHSTKFSIFISHPDKLKLKTKLLGL
jgi:hypothetical protein